MARPTLQQLHDAMAWAAQRRDLPGYLSLVRILREEYPDAAAAFAVAVSERYEEADRG